MRQVVIVSNRVPSVDDQPDAGGLAVALKAVLQEHGGLWLGWSGRTADAPSRRASITEAGGFTLATIDLTEADRAGYYDGLANRALWPVLHGRLDLARFDYSDYTAYRAVNGRFADALLPELARGAIIWVHDYHLLPLGRLLRNREVRAPIGFFLHTPFPSAETFAALPWAFELVDDLAAYDLIGFQTEGCVRNFLDFAERHGLGRPLPGGRVAIGGRTIKVGAFPIAADTEALSALAASPTVTARVAHFRAVLGSRTSIAGVDRIDYSKGLPERFEAIDSLLNSHPEWIGRTTLFQIAAPSRLLVPEYRAIQTGLEAMSGRINGQYGSLDWTPIRLMIRAVARTQVAALLRGSRVGLVTPLRDGMNLVAKEYVAVQDPSDPGVLVLSRFAGAADELPSAVLVNPHDIEGTARALWAALEMPASERIERWSAMMRHLTVHDVDRWRRRFMDALIRPGVTAVDDVPTAATEVGDRRLVAGMRWPGLGRPTVRAGIASPERARAMPGRRLAGTEVTTGERGVGVPRAKGG